MEEAFAKWFKKHLEDQGYRRTEFAELLGVVRQMVAAYLDGSRLPTASRLDTICAYLEVEITDSERRRFTGCKGRKRPQIGARV
jgi:transcriptional regulator with XRE-family HTH domain